MHKKRIFIIVFTTVMMLVMLLVILNWVINAYLTDYIETRYFCEYRLPYEVRIIRREDYKQKKLAEQYFIEIKGKLYLLVADSNTESNLFCIENKTVTPIKPQVVEKEKARELLNKLPREYKCRTSNNNNFKYEFSKDIKYSHY